MGAFDDAFFWTTLNAFYFIYFFSLSALLMQDVQTRWQPLFLVLGARKQNNGMAYRPSTLLD